MIALYPGAYKPPHRGHFNVVKSLLDGSYNGSIYDKDNYKETGANLLKGRSNNKPKIDKVIVFVGAGERNGITKEESMSIWKVYSKYLGNVEIRDGESNPMFAAKDYAQANPKQEFVSVTGIRGDKDFVDLRRITTFKNAPNVSGLALAAAPGSGVRATDFRNRILSGNLDKVLEFFPEDLSKEEISAILVDLKDKIVSEVLADSIEGFITEYFQTDIPVEAHIEKAVVEENLDNQETIRPEYTQYIGSILEYMIEQNMNILPLPEVKVRYDEKNAANFFGRTAYYDPNNKEIVLYGSGRHPKDICRSFTHEMIHHIQNLEGRLVNIGTQNTNEDDALLELEKEAYLKGNITFRNWTDSVVNGDIPTQSFSNSSSLNEDLTLSPFDYDQDGNESRIKRDINNRKGWRRLGSKSSQNIAIKKYLDKYTSGYKWSNAPKSEKFSDENVKMYKTPYIMYVHLLQTSEGKNNIVDALNGMIANEPDNTMKQILQALNLIFSDKEDEFKKVYTQYKSMIEKNANDDSGANPFAALKYASENFKNKVEIFNKFIRNGWSAGKFNLNEDLKEAIVGDKIECDNCDWSWNIKDGGDDLYICHKCGHDNEPHSTPINEGKYDKITNVLSKVAFTLFKRLHDKGEKKGKFNLRVGNPEHDEVDIPSKQFEFDLQGYFTLTDDTYSVDGGANAGYDDEGDEIQPLLNLNFSIPKEIDWQEVSMDIKDVVRHELEHLTQDGENLKPGKFIEDDEIIRGLIDMGLMDKDEYYKLPKEVDAMIQGMYFKAKKSKTPFKDVVEDYFNKAGVELENREKIRILWNKRLPKLGIKQRL